MSGAKLLAGMAETVWAITESKLAAILEFVEHRIEHGKMSDAEIRAALGGVDDFTRAQTVERYGPVAVMNLTGTISQKANLVTRYSGGTSTEQFASLFQETMADPAVKAMVINIDSPGGSVFGVQELSDLIFGARGQGKRMTAVANPMAFSAAYWIGTAADRLVVTPSGEVGSVGVLAVHVDESARNAKAGYAVTIVRSSENKAAFSNLEPLSDVGYQQIKAGVDRIRDQFVADVARNRAGVKAKAPKDFGGGLTYGAADAVKNGMADGVGTLQGVIQAEIERLRSEGRVGAARTQFAMAAMESGK